ncbi:MAG: GNAT family N-acetyltransferase [Bdellovibrionaceae bacterium]|nr:GNAT family N-acetyltransferase [Pseudobdellovibrionaceae bacterium]MDW8189773.1 GNAT family N-acetyltransferase [Pseudobdellovibrionaceae bacterium]
MTKLDQIVAFLSQELRKDCQWSISAEYPQVFQPQNIHNLKFIEKDGRIVTHAALKPLIIKTPQFILKVATIGSVVTAPDFRNQGLSTLVMQSCLEEARRQSCDIAVLWTHLHDWYRRLGFELAGYEEHFFIERPLPLPSSAMTPLKIIQGPQVEAAAILKLYQQHTINSYRTVKDIEAFLRIPNSQIYTGWDQNNELRAYSVVGKGADLQDHVHEWGGNIPDLITLWNHMVTIKPFTVLIGPHSTNLISTLQKYKLIGMQGYLGMFKIVCLDQLSEKIKRAIKQMGGKTFNISLLENSTIMVTIDELNISLRSEAELIRLIFGPVDESQFPVTHLPTIRKYFPFPLWIWGWDSI